MTFIEDPEGAGGLIPADSRGRVLVSAEQREALLDAFERSGQSGVGFCRQHGLKYPTFAGWVRKRGRDAAQLREKTRAPAFAEVMLDVPSAAPATPTGSLAVTLPDGSRIDITCRSQLPWAAELLRQFSSTRLC